MISILLATTFILSAQPVDTAKIKPSYQEVNDFVEDNESCLKCHGELKYTIADPEQGRVMTERMCPDRIIDRNAYYTGVHKAFACSDCHSYGFEEFPHSVETRLEEMMLCMDCHGYDETFAKYHFESIETEYEESIHNMEEFSCWKC
ncbi:MAG: hypothetical protein KAT15_22375, partial [Bacteroidales bacterium]|nr:hypothetical protein [Bacteroidales bacterium]